VKLTKTKFKNLRKNLIYIFISVLAVACSEGNKSEQNNDDGKKPNALITETSPYLLQHAYNPVDWRAWNDESLALAKTENKLIVISVGYSACHWCHVMEKESFENDSVAMLMNENFINIKVDREERPDVDQVYMNAVQLMTGGGGWPLNCITLPDGRPVFGGTYFTKNQWTKILEDMSSLYKNNPEKVISYAEKLTEGVKNSDLITVNTAPVEFNRDELAKAVNELEKSLDFELGGQKEAPKFPMPSHLNFLLRYSFHNMNEALQNYVFRSLNTMANGGIYDHVAGGFSRYSVDDRWHVPHFEKMLYDNGQLVSLYSQAYALTKNADYKRVIEETLDFVNTELKTKEGAFYSSLDADSFNSNNEMEEGAYYVWTIKELQSLLKEDFQLFKAYYNVNSVGKWEKDLYILYKTTSPDEFAKSNNLTLEELNSKITYWTFILKEARAKRSKPRLDDKVLTSWNALMLKAYVDAYNAIGRDDYLQNALTNAQFIVDKQMMDSGELFHSYKNGKSTIEGFSEDYAHTIAAFIDLYQATFDEKWLNQAKNLMEYTIDHFMSNESGMFYFTSNNASKLITRKTEVFDNVISSSNSILADCLFKLGHYYSDTRYADLASQMLRNVNDAMLKSPSAYTNWLALYLNYSNPYYEVAISGDEAFETYKELKQHYLPNILISGSSKESSLPLLENKYNKSETLIYVCVNGTCKLPVNAVDRALSQIAK